MMHCVLMNRLKHPSDFAAGRYASTITQIISARSGHVHFMGFENYPITAEGHEDNIEDKISVALDGEDPRIGIYVDFVKPAVAASKDPSPIDPTPTVLFFWVTSGSPRPGDHAVLFQSVGGNDFYTWSKSKPKGNR